MTELRRLLIGVDRLRLINSDDDYITLNPNESHYLKRVLRLKIGQEVEVVDGCGNLWTACLQSGEKIKLNTPFNMPIKSEPKPYPLIGLGVAVPRRGFDEVLRMSCELGIDFLQPLLSDRSSPQVVDRSSRWGSIIREASEQSERLWKPKLLDLVNASRWWSPPSENSAFAIAITRKEGLQDFQFWLQKLPPKTEQVFIAIGPEGGWSPKEESFALRNGWTSVHLGNLILTTSTAAVGATQLMTAWRRCRT